MDIKIYTDGASRNNPGESASGYLIINNNEEILECFYNGIKTNNEAEYIAVILAMKKLISLKEEKNNLVFFSDSKLMVNQLCGRYKIKKPELIKLNETALSLSKKFQSCKFNSVLRTEKNIGRVDYALNMLLDKQAKT